MKPMRFALLLGVLLAGCGSSGTPGGDGCRTCESAGVVCGTIDDGCGGTLECGPCTDAAPADALGDTAAAGGDAVGDVPCLPLDSPAACRHQGWECGAGLAEDGCGGLVSVDCGGCPSGQGCGAGVMAHRCASTACEPESDAIVCGRNGLECGAAEAADNCGQTRSVDCGGCEPDEGCGVGGHANRCEPTSCAESDAEFCARHDFRCGTGRATDECGNERSAFCGTCPQGLTCGADEPNRCACRPETAVALCARLAAECGPIVAQNNCGTQRTWDCGGCPDGQRCGFSGIANRCGAPAVESVAVSSPLPIPTDAERTRPAVAVADEVFLVAWAEDGSIRAVRVRRSDGALLDPRGILVVDDWHIGLNGVRVASDGRDFLVADVRGRGARRVAGSDGRVLDTEDIAIGEQVRSLAFAAGSYWALTQDSYGASDALVRIDPDSGAVRRRSAIPADPDGTASVRGGAGGLLVAWRDGRYRAASRGDIWAARYGADGTLLDPDGILICDDAHEQDPPVVLPYGSGWLVVWADERTPESFWAATVDGATGAVAPPDGQELAGVEVAGRLGTDGDDLVWARLEENGDGRCGVRVTRFDAAGLVDPPGVLADVDTDCSHVYEAGQTLAVVGDGTRRLTVTGTAYETYSSSIRFAGTVTGPDGTLHGPRQQFLTTRVVRQGAIGSAFDGELWLAAWYEENLDGGLDVRLTVADADGEPLTPDGRIVVTAPPLLATDPVQVGVIDGAFVMAWSERSHPVGTLRAARVTRDGTPGPAVVVHEAPNGVPGPTMACAGESCLLAWSEEVDPVYHADLLVARVTSAGRGLTVEPPTPVELAAGAQTQASLASDGSGYLVAWVDTRHVQREIYAARLDAAGLLQGEPVMLGDDVGIYSQVRAAFDGSDYVVLWVDDVSELRSNRVRPETGARLDGDGVSFGADGHASAGFAATRSGSAVTVVYGTYDENQALRLEQGRIADGPYPMPAGYLVAPPDSGDGARFATVVSVPNPNQSDHRAFLHAFSW